MHMWKKNYISQKSKILLERAEGRMKALASVFEIMLLKCSFRKADEDAWG